MKKTKSGAIKIILSSLWWMLLICLALLLVTVIGAKMRGEVPKVFGYSVMRIVSGSMEDEIPTGSYILVKECDPADVKKGDIISFYSDDKSILGYPNTHKVVDDPKKSGEEYYYTTKGTANMSADSVPARGSRLIGVYVKDLDFLTRFSSFLDGNVIFCVLLVLQIATFAMIIYSFAVKKNDKEEGEEGENKN